MPDPLYDTAEAIQLIDEFAEAASPSRRERVAVSLVSELADLLKARGFYTEVNSGTNSLEVCLGQRLAHVGVDNAGSLFVLPNGGKSIPVRLVFDRQRKAFRSTVKDEFYAPTPGQPVPCRSALAELAQATLSALRASVQR